jgi:hypothetical protein
MKGNRRFYSIFDEEYGPMPTSLPKRHDTRTQEETAARGVSIFSIAVVVGFVAWCVADHIRNPSSAMASYASAPITHRDTPR